MKTAVVITLRNEEISIEKLIKSINLQTKIADEIIFVDGGSNDSTVKILENFKASYKGKAKIKVITKELNRAAGRNVGIKIAKSEIIAITDAGCVLKKNWLEKITAPFADKKIDVVAGFYLPTVKSPFEKSLATYTCVPIDKVKSDFLPSSRSVAFRKKTWESVNGYPEHLDTCEDLEFARRMKEKKLNFFVEKKAIVYWRQKSNIFSAFIQLLGYAMGDGKARYFRFQTPLIFLRYIVGLLLLFKFLITGNILIFYLLIALFLFYILWSIKKNYLYTKSFSSIFFLPALQIVSDFAVLLGMPLGFLKGFFNSNKKRTVNNAPTNHAKAALHGSGWMGLLQISSRLFTFLKYAVILRVLTPLDFGIYSLAVIILGTTEVFTELGVQQFLIQRNDGNKYVNAAFVLSIIRGIIVFGVLVALSYPLAVFFNQKELVNSMLLISVIPLIKGFLNPNIFYFQRNLQFHKDVALKFIGIFTDSLFSILLILLAPTVIMLFVALLISALAETIFSYVLIQKFPRLKIKMGEFKEILNFSKWLVSAGGIYYMSTQIDTFIIGKYLGVSTLGIYQAAQRFSLKVMSETGDIPAKVSFPIFSNISTDKIRLRNGFIKTFYLVSVSWGILAFALFLFSEQIILLLLGEKWFAANILFKIFVVSGYLQVLMGIITSFFLGIGRQDFTAKIVGLKLVSVLILIVPLIYLFNSLGAAIAGLISTAISFPLALFYIKRYL